ncbi:MAG: hypothetical protein H6757_06615 [Candidatus Omnitrophica bacterium]|nr:hypothetical protein [Candidatus Omnitrophota bacterium]
MNFYASSAFFNGLIALFLVYYIYLRDKKDPLSRSFLYFGIVISGWSFLYTFWAYASSAAEAEKFIRLHMTFATFIPATYFHLVYHLTYQTRLNRSLLKISYGISVFYSLLCHTSLMVSGVKQVVFFDFWPAPGKLLLSHVIYFGLLMSYSMYLLIQKTFSSGRADKQRLQWILAGSLIGIGGGSVNWLLWFDIPVPPTTHFTVGIMFALFAYAIIRHRLIDIDEVLQIARRDKLAAIGTLAASMNHEIRNPLFIIKGAAETHLVNVKEGIYASKEKALDKANQILATSFDQAQRAIDLMKTFSEFAKKDNDRKVRIEEVYLKEVFENIQTLIDYELKLDKAEMLVDIPESLMLSVDRRHLEEILFNLLINACQAMKAAGGKIELRATFQNNKTQIMISDTGPGIPKDKLSQIFDPFYTSKEEGTGLGLYITKQLVERNGGTITVQSQPGQGTKFILEFNITEMK